MNKPTHQFTSDNRSRICPEAWAALAAANADADSASYGNDRWTQHAAELIRKTFETNCDVYFVFTGTAANSLALASLCQSYHSVICHEAAHIETDECGAPEFFSNGTKLLTAPGPDGKLTPAAVDALVQRRTDIHYPKPAGAEVRDLRRRHALSQGLLARLLDVSLRSVSGLESGSVAPAQLQRNLVQVTRLCGALAEAMESSYVGRWLDEPNEMLGGLKPVEAVERGQIDLVWQVVEGLRSGSQL